MTPAPTKANKRQISITLDPELLDRIDAVSAKRGEPRSAMIERILSNEVDSEEQFIRDMESPMIRALARALVETPAVVKTVTTLAGQHLTEEHIGRIKAGLKEQAELGKERAKQAKAGRTKGVLKHGTA